MTYRKLRPAVITGMVTALPFALLMGCSDPGPAEEAGEAVDDAWEETRDRADDAAESVGDMIDEPGPAEEAGREVDDALDG